MPPRSQKDWEAISRHYRAGVRSLRDIGDEFGVSEGAIRKRAKKEDWPRDLSEQIKAKAAAKVRIQSIRSGTVGASEKEIIDAESEIQSRIALAHRKDIPLKRKLVGKLFAEIEAMTDGKDLLKALEEALASGDQNAMAKEVRKIVSLPQRIKGTTELTSAYKSLIALEREAFGIGSGDSGADDPLAKIIEKVQARQVDLVKAARNASNDSD